MKASLFCAVLLCATSVSFARWAQQRQVTECAERGTIGLICSDDCEHVAFCRKEGSLWIREEVDTCTNGQTCNLLHGGCSDEPGACSSAGTITCHNEGLFPDPYDCQRYYICTEQGEEAQLKECGKNRAFDVVSGQCRLKTSADVCHDLPVKCEKPGEHGAWPGNDNLYYVCKAKFQGEKKIVYPELFRCDVGFVYDKEEGCKEFE